MREHCAHARFVWNLCAEQQSWWRPGRKAAPSWVARCRQLTEARAEFEWLRNGSRIVQAQAVRDFDQAMKNYFGAVHQMPGWRKARRHEGFRNEGHWSVRRVSRHVGEVVIPKAGWVRFRWSRALPEAKSYRVTLDYAGRWHIAFASAVAPVAGAASGNAIGVDRGVRTALVTSDGQHYRVPRIGDRSAARYLALQQRMSRQGKKSAKRERTRRGMAVIAARTADRRKDWAEKISTRMVRQHDVIVLEKLNIRGMTRKPAPKPDVEQPGNFLPNGACAKAGLSRGILASCWGVMASRLEQKAAASGVTLLQVNARFTSQQCHVCGHTAAGNRESQAVFRCQSCGHEDHADRNAARNILARGLLLTTGEVVPAHTPGHGVSGPQKSAKAAAGTTRSAA
jgi:transposase